MVLCAGAGVLPSTIQALARAKPLGRGRFVPLPPLDEKEGGSKTTHLDDRTLHTAESSPSAALTVAAWGESWLRRREREGLASSKDDRRIWRTHVASEPWALLPLTSMATPEGRELVIEWWTSLHEKRSSNPTHKKKTRVLAATTLRNIRQTVRKCFAEAVEIGRLAFNPFALLKISRSRRRTTRDPIRVLFKEEQARAFALFSGWQRLIVEFLVGSGLRLGEWRALRLEDAEALDTNAPTILIRYGAVSLTRPDDPMAESIKGAWFTPTKGGKPRRIPLLELAATALRAWLAQLRKFAPRNPHRLVFPMPDGAPRKKGRVFRGFARIAKMIGRPFTWHGCRHTCITSLVAGWWTAPWTKEAAQAFAGHSTVKVTERYVQFLEDAAVVAARRSTNWGASMAEVDGTKSAEVEAGSDSSKEEEARRFSSVVEQRFRNTETDGGETSQSGDGSPSDASSSDGLGAGGSTGDEPPSLDTGPTDRDLTECSPEQVANAIALLEGGRKLAPATRGIVYELMQQRDDARRQREDAREARATINEVARELAGERDDARAAAVAAGLQAQEMMLQRNEWRDEASANERALDHFAAEQRKRDAARAAAIRSGGVAAPYTPAQWAAARAANVLQQWGGLANDAIEPELLGAFFAGRAYEVAYPSGLGSSSSFAEGRRVRVRGSVALGVPHGEVPEGIIKEHDRALFCVEFSKGARAWFRGDELEPVSYSSSDGSPVGEKGSTRDDASSRVEPSSSLCAGTIVRSRSPLPSERGKRWKVLATNGVIFAPMNAAGTDHETRGVDALRAESFVLNFEGTNGERFDANASPSSSSSSSLSDDERLELIRLCDAVRRVAQARAPLWLELMALQPGDEVVHVDTWGCGCPGPGRVTEAPKEIDGFMHVRVVTGCASEWVDLAEVRLHKKANASPYCGAPCSSEPHVRAGLTCADVPNHRAGVHRCIVCNGAISPTPPRDANPSPVSLEPHIEFSSPEACDAAGALLAVAIGYAVQSVPSAQSVDELRGCAERYAKAAGFGPGVRAESTETTDTHDRHFQRSRVAGLVVNPELAIGLPGVNVRTHGRTSPATTNEEKCIACDLPNGPYHAVAEAARGRTSTGQAAPEVIAVRLTGRCKGCPFVGVLFDGLCSKCEEASECGAAPPIGFDVDERAPDMATAAAAVAERDVIPFGERATSRGLEDDGNEDAPSRDALELDELRTRHRVAVGLLTDVERPLAAVRDFLSREVNR